MKVALAFVLLASSVLSLAATENERILLNRRREKSSKAKAKEKQNQLRMEDIEGVYAYVNKCGQTYLARITCFRYSNSIFENAVQHPDPLCSYSEYKVADLVEDNQEGAEAVLDDDGNVQGYMVINPDAQTDGEPIDENNVCVYAGRFRESSALKGNVLRSIPLATSNGCKISTKNYQYVVGGELLDNGDMKLSFSSDYGATLYTDDEDLCPKTYVAMKLDGNKGGRRRSLSNHCPRQDYLCRICDPSDESFDFVGCNAANLAVCTVEGPLGDACVEVNAVFRVSYYASSCLVGWFLGLC